MTMKNKQPQQPKKTQRAGGVTVAQHRYEQVQRIDNAMLFSCMNMASTPIMTRFRIKLMMAFLLPSSRCHAYPGSFEDLSLYLS
jgi:hypothetical protein